MKHFQKTILKKSSKDMKKMLTAERGLITFLPTSLMNVTTEHPGAVTQKHGWPDWDMCSVDAHK